MHSAGHRQALLLVGRPPAIGAVLMVIFVLTFQLLWSADALAWTVDLENDVRFQRVINDSLLLVGTERHLFALDIHTGKVVWRFRNLEIESDEILLAPDFELLLANEGWGGEFQDKQSNVLGVALNTGQLLWESPTVKERVLTVVPDLDNDRVLMVTAKKPHGKDRGGFEREPRLYMLETSSGKIVWQADLGNEIRLTPKTPTERQAKKKYYSFNLAAYHSPVFHDDKVLVLFDGIRCFDARTGRLLWNKKFDIFEGSLSRSYAEPLFDERNAYVAGEGEVRAFRLADGRQIWKTGDQGVVTELYGDENLIYGKLGGTFYDFADDEWDKKGPFGVVVFDRRSGKRVWRWDNGDDGVSNLLIAGDRVYFADEEHLVALDRYKGKRLYRESHKFEKAPRFIGLNESDQLVLTGDENAAGFRRGDGVRVWLRHHEPPGIVFWKRLAAGFLATTGAILTVSSYAVALQRNLMPAAPPLANRVFNYRNKLIKLGRAAGKGLIGSGGNLLQRSRYAQLDGSHQYFFTKLPAGGKGLLGVSLNNGTVDHTLALKESNVELVVSESNRKVFQIDGTRVVAYDLQQSGAPPALRKPD